MLINGTFGERGAIMGKTPFVCLGQTVTPIAYKYLISAMIFSEKKFSTSQCWQGEGCRSKSCERERNQRKPCLMGSGMTLFKKNGKQTFWGYRRAFKRHCFLKDINGKSICGEASAKIYIKLNSETSDCQSDKSGWKKEKLGIL